MQNSISAPQHMKEIQHQRMGESVQIEENAKYLRDERGMTYPTVIGTGMVPVIGNQKQQ